MVIIRRLKRGVTPPPPPHVGGGGRKVKYKCIGQKKQGGKASKGVGEACRKIRQSMRNFPETTDSDTTDESDDEVNRWYLSPLLEGNVKERADEGEYNIFSNLRRGCIRYCVLKFHHVKLCVFSATFYHIHYTISP